MLTWGQRVQHQMKRETPDHLQSSNVYLSVRPWPQNDSNQALYKKTSCLLWGSWKHRLALKKEPLCWTSYKFQSFQRSNQYRVFRSKSVSFCLKRGKRRKTFWWFIYISNRIVRSFFCKSVCENSEYCPCALRGQKHCLQWRTLDPLKERRLCSVT